LAERDLQALRKAYVAELPAVVRVYSPGASEALATGKLTFVDSAVDTTSGTIAAKAEFANEHFELWPGMYVDIEVDLAVRPNTVMVPAVAIQSGQSGPFVFVVTADKKAAMRKIELLGIAGDLAALSSGVKDGEQVIVEGQMRLVDGARVDIVPADDKKGGNNNEKRDGSAETPVAPAATPGTPNTRASP
jgi:multidrug efflux system membrane fusion protein